MNFRIDLLDPTTGNKTGNYPITSRGPLTRRTILSRIGVWEFPVEVADPAAADIEGKDFAVYWQWRGQTQYLGQCSYLDHQIAGGSDSPAIQVRAAGKLRDLTRQTVLARSFDGATDDVNDVLSEIVPLRSGWSLGSVDTIAKAAPMDFWYENIFDSVALLAETFGYHFREGDSDKTLDFGAFGDDSGVLAVGGGPRELPPSVYGNANLCQITDISVAYKSPEVINRLIPFGGALGVATIDLGLTTSTQAGYPVQTGTLPSGESYYYIEDSASQATYGLTERRFLRKDLRPISNSPTARQYAANILYEAALASLLNVKDRQIVYDLAAIGLKPGLLKVGDKIRVFFRGWVSTPTGARTWLDLDGQFWVLEIVESFGDGVATRLKINENDVQEETVEDLLANTIKKFEQSQIHVQPTASRYTFGPYTKRVSNSPSVDGEFSFKLGPETLDVWYVKLLIKGEKLKSSVTGAASGGGSTSGPSSTSSSSGGSAHSHNITVYGGSASPSYDVHWDANNSRFHLPSVGSGTDDAQTSSTESSHTHNIDHTHTTPDHTHPMSYGIFEDTVRPNDLTIKVNGNTVASGVTLSSPNYDYEVDITSQILAAATLQQEHSITVECGSNRGEIELQAQVLAVIQPIQIS